MKKTIAFGITALTIAAACGPISAQAAGNRLTVRTNQNNRTQVVRVYKNPDCDINDLLGKLEGLGLNRNCNKLGSVIINGNCPSIPGIGGGNIDRPNKPGNGGGGIEKPDQPGNGGGGIEKPDQPGNGGGGIEKPDQPGNGGGGIEKPDQPGNGGGNVDKPDQDANSSYASQVVKLVNAERAKEGLAPLAIDTKSASAAQVRAKEIQSSFSHTRPNGSSFSTALKEAGVNYRGSGENIAWGQKTPEDVVKAWMNSPSHRANIMNKSYTTIGVGHLQNSSGVSYWVQLFTY